jgi:FkbM family methyltransferase
MLNPKNIFVNYNEYEKLLNQSKNKIRENKITILKTTNGTMIAVRHNIYDIKIIKEQFIDLQYFLDVFENNFQPKTVLDIGGYIGDLSLYCASMFNANIHCYEPTPQNYKMIKTNLDLNPMLQKHITVYNEGISNSNDPIKLNVQDVIGEIHASSHKVYKNNVSTIEIPCITLNQAIAKMNESKIDLLKIDCEGQEFNILDNIDSNELSQKVKYLVFEYHNFVDDYEIRLEKILKNLKKDFDLLKKSKNLCFLKSKI